LGANLAVVLDGHHSVEKAIFFDETAVDYIFVRILLRSVLERISFLLLFFVCLLGGVRISFIFNFNVDMVAVTGESRDDVVILVLVKGVHIAEGAEHKVI